VNNWIQWIIEFGIITLMGIITYFLRDMKLTFAQRDIENKEDIKCLKKEFEDFKEKIPEKYVMKEEFVRAMTTVDKRFDFVDEKLDKIYFTIVKGCENK
jgi:hypothetical protein